MAPRKRPNPRGRFFVLWKQLGGDDALGDRHDWAAANGLPRSTKDWSSKHWATAFAILDGAAHPAPTRLPDGLDTTANEAQVRWLEDLRHQILWDFEDGLERYIRRRVLREPPPGVPCARWGGTIRSLDRRVAYAAIDMLRGTLAAQTCPRCDHAKCPRNPDTTRRTCPVHGDFGRRARRRERQPANV